MRVVHPHMSNADPVDSCYEGGDHGEKSKTRQYYTNRLGLRESLTVGYGGLKTSNLSLSRVREDHQAGETFDIGYAKGDVWNARNIVP